MVRSATGFFGLFARPFVANPFVANPFVAACVAACVVAVVGCAAAGEGEGEGEVGEGEGEVGEGEGEGEGEGDAGRALCPTCVSGGDCPSTEPALNTDCFGTGVFDCFYCDDDAAAVFVLRCDGIQFYTRELLAACE